MKARHTLPLLTCVLLAPPAHADNPTHSEAHAQIAAFYAKKDAALKTHDYAAFEALSEQFALPSFTLTLPSKRTLTLAQMLKGMKQSFAGALPETAEKTTIVRVTVTGSTANDTNTVYSAGPFVDMDGRYGPKGARHHYTALEREQVRFIKEGRIWKVASVRILSETETVDGKPIKSDTGPG